MIFQILACEDKAADWKVVTVKEAIEGGQTFSDVSLNKMNREKTAVAFANFDDLKVGATLEADYWRSATNKQYLFAPKPKSQSGGGARNSAAITKAQETKAEHIKEAQENRAQGVKLAAAMRDATQITLAVMSGTPFPTDEEFKAEFTKWRDWYLQEWDKTEKAVDVPFTN